MTTPHQQPDDATTNLAPMADAIASITSTNANSAAAYAEDDAAATMPAITHPKKRAFLTAFALCGTVTGAASRAGINRRSHSLWMDADGPDGDEYRAAFAEAQAEAAERLEAEMRRRAVEGVDRGVYYHGERVDTQREYSDTLLIFALKGALPDKYRDNAPAQVTVAVAVTVDL